MHDRPSPEEMMTGPDLPPALAPLKREIEASLKPAVALLPDPTAGGRTHFGGQPLGARGARWPRSPARPMSFIGQIDLADVGLAGMPEHGLLQLFYDVEEQKWGFDRSDRDWWVVVYVAEGEPLVPVPVPAERFASFERTMLAVRPYLSLPSPLDERWSRTVDAGGNALSDAYGELLGEWQATVFGSAGQAHQVLGHADWVQGDARVEAETIRRDTSAGEPGGDASDWQLLWQVASDDALGFMWGDLGYLYLMARRAESADGDFSRCHLTLQCG